MLRYADITTQPPPKHIMAVCRVLCTVLMLYTSFVNMLELLVSNHCSSQGSDILNELLTYKK